MNELASRALSCCMLYPKDIHGYFHQTRKISRRSIAQVWTSETLARTFVANMESTPTETDRQALAAAFVAHATHIWEFPTLAGIRSEFAEGLAPTMKWMRRRKVKGFAIFICIVRDEPWLIHSSNNSFDEIPPRDISRAFTYFCGPKENRDAMEREFHEKLQQTDARPLPSSKALISSSSHLQAVIERLYATTGTCERCRVREVTLRCSRCMWIFYCSAPCQRADWVTSHKNVCIEYQMLRSRAEEAAIRSHERALESSAELVSAQ